MTNAFTELLVWTSQKENEPDFLYELKNDMEISIYNIKYEIDEIHNSWNMNILKDKIIDLDVEVDKAETMIEQYKFIEKEDLTEFEKEYNKLIWRFKDAIDEIRGGRNDW